MASPQGPVLLSDDVAKLLFTVSSVEDLEEAAKALRAFIGRSGAARAKNTSVQRMNRKLTKDLLLLCRALSEQGGIKVADSLMQDKEFVAQLNLFGSDFAADAEEGAEGGSMAMFAPKILITYAQVEWLFQKSKHTFMCGISFEICLFLDTVRLQSLPRPLRLI